MVTHIVLASGSTIRAQLLKNAGLGIDIAKPNIDEDAIKDALIAEEAKPRDIADTLAEMKAQKISDKRPGSLVLGCDQVLEHQGHIMSKPRTPDEAKTQIRSLSGNRHSLLSAAVIYEDGKPVWRHVGVARLLMRDVTDEYLDDYVTRNWDSIRHSVGGYKLEEEGVRLFHRIDGDYFTILGLPLLELLSYLTLRGEIAG